MATRQVDRQAGAFLRGRLGRVTVTGKWQPNTKDRHGGTCLPVVDVPVILALACTLYVQEVVRSTLHVCTLVCAQEQPGRLRQHSRQVRGAAPAGEGAQQVREHSRQGGRTTGEAVSVLLPRRTV